MQRIPFGSHRVQSNNTIYTTCPYYTHTQAPIAVGNKTAARTEQEREQVVELAVEKPGMEGTAKRNNGGERAIKRQPQQGGSANEASGWQSRTRE